MNINFNHILRKRLRDQEKWLQDFLIYKKHTDIDAEAKRKYYEKSPILSFFLMVYLFPINSLNFVYRLRGMYFYEKCKTEIEVLKKELEQTTRKRNL